MSETASKEEVLAQTSGYLRYLAAMGVDSVPPVGGGSPTESDPAEAMAALRRDIGDCTRCRLHRGRTSLVFGAGNPGADLMFVGEAPGREEDLQGEPFVGPAGQLLTKIIQAMGFQREQVYIANVVKCRPPQNRNPEPDEVASCAPFLERQIAIVNPKIIVALGTFSAQCLIKTDARISTLRGVFHSHRGIPVMPTFHPSFLLRNPERKRDVWEDMKKVMKHHGEIRGKVQS